MTFTGTNVGFGATVRQIGDIDSDGLQDIAIAHRPTGLRVFIYKGRATWPAALTDAQADYVIMSDASFAEASSIGDHRVGDFNGRRVNDMVITAPLYSSRLGRVLVVFGRTGFTSFTAPDMTRALEIGADPALARTQLGVAVVSSDIFTPARARRSSCRRPVLRLSPATTPGGCTRFTVEVPAPLSPQPPPITSWLARPWVADGK